MNRWIVWACDGEIIEKLIRLIAKGSNRFYMDGAFYPESNTGNARERRDRSVQPIQPHSVSKKNRLRLPLLLMTDTELRLRLKMTLKNWYTSESFRMDVLIS